MTLKATMVINNEVVLAEVVSMVVGVVVGVIY